MKRLGSFVIAIVVIVVGASSAVLLGQYGVKTGDWTSSRGDNGSTRYSPLDQINRENVRNLQVAWTFKTDKRVHGRPQSESAPIMPKGVLYFTAGPKRHAIALDAATGETRWSYVFDEGMRGDRAPRKNTRGVSYWTDGREERIILVTPGFHLVALNAKTGQPVAGFGTAGVIDLYQEIDLDFKGDPIGLLGNTSPAVVSNDTIIVGAALPVGTRVNKENVKADVLAFDVRTGKKKWVFHTVPRKGEAGSETWKTGLDYTARHTDGSAVQWRSKLGGRSC